MTVERDDDKRDLQDLGRRLAAARKTSQPDSSTTARSRDFGVAYRVFIEMAAGVAVGGGLGWFLDGWLGTRPWLMVALCALGFAAGISNALRAARQLANEAERRDQAGGKDSSER